MTQEDKAEVVYIKKDKKDTSDEHPGEDLKP